MNIYMLFGLFQLKHFLCDYPLQTTEMVLGKGKLDQWVKPLLKHSAVHAIGTFIIAMLVTSPSMALGLSILDFGGHFIVDRVKAHPKIGGRYKLPAAQFWWSLGADQMAYHIINIYFVYVLMS